MAGSASDVTQAYNESLALGSLPEAASFAGALRGQPSTGTDAQPKASDTPPPTGSGHIVRVTARSGSQEGLFLYLKSGISDLTLDVEFRIDPELPAPGLAFGFSDGLNQTIASVISIHDGVKLTVDAQGRGKGTVSFPKIPLLKGEYAVTVFLSTEDALHPYDQVTHCVKFRVTQDSVEQGIVTLPHNWHTS
jgi:lipopolysaccharide transport system ATP-binding protein